MKSCNEILLFPLSYFDLRWGPKNGLNARSPFEHELYIWSVNYSSQTRLCIHEFPLRFYASCVLQKGCFKKPWRIIKPGPDVIKLFFMLNSAEHEILNAQKYKTIKTLSFFSGSDKPTMLFFPPINVKMPTIVGILTFTSRKFLMLSWAEHEKSSGQSVNCTIWTRIFALSVDSIFHIMLWICTDA